MWLTCQKPFLQSAPLLLPTKTTMELCTEICPSRMALVVVKRTLLGTATTHPQKRDVLQEIMAKEDEEPIHGLQRHFAILLMGQ